MSDLHLGKKPWQVRKALKMASDADVILLAGDLTNDGTPEQIELMHQCISELLPDKTVLAVAGNHDYPRNPLPIVRDGIWDYPALEEWLLKRQPHAFALDNSGAWAVQMGKVDIIGLNCVSHWRRFKFQDGAQLRWLAQYLPGSNAQWHIVLCHAPLLAHNPKRSDTKPYLSRDTHLQSIIDGKDHIIFISGHTHVSMKSSGGCVELDAARSNLYINDGSIRPTTLLRNDGKPEIHPDDGNIVEILMDDEQIAVNAYSTTTGERFSSAQYRFPSKGTYDQEASGR